jgi:hypothetical protein
MKGVCFFTGKDHINSVTSLRDCFCSIFTVPETFKFQFSPHCSAKFLLSMNQKIDAVILIKGKHTRHHINLFILLFSANSAGEAIMR